jgi:hypothetical protein
MLEKFSPESAPAVAHFEGIKGIVAAVALVSSSKAIMRKREKAHFGGQCPFRMAQSEFIDQGGGN